MDNLKVYLKDSPFSYLWKLKLKSEGLTPTEMVAHPIDPFYLSISGETFFDIDLKYFVQQCGEKSTFASKYNPENESFIHSGVAFIKNGEPANLSLVKGDILKTDASLDWIVRIKRPALFVDRDGILMTDVPYQHQFSKVTIIPEVLPLLRAAKAKDWALIVLTNQSGVGRGRFSQATLDQFHREMQEYFSHAGVPFDGIYSCPYHPVEGIGEYKKESYLRKPHPGMALVACEDHSLILEKSIMLGDKDSDRLNYPELKHIIIQGSYPIDPSKKSYRHHTEALGVLKSYLENQ